MALQGIRFIPGLLLLAAAGVSAQPPASAAVVAPLVGETQEVPAALSSDVQESSITVAAPVSLQTAAQALEYDLPAGVCPVITDYLYQQCEQNPADAMCAPATVTE
jgi:hypothetical protein